EAKRIVAEVDVVHLEGKWPLVRHPAGELRARRSQVILARVEEHAARPAAHPLQHAAEIIIDVQRAHVERDDPAGVIPVEDDSRADSVRLFDDRLHVEDIRAAKQHVADRHQQRPLVDRVDDLLDRHGDPAVLALDHVQLNMRRQHPAQHVIHGRENARFDHYLVARTVEVIRRQQDAHRDRDVLVHRDGIWRRADDLPDLVAQRQVHVPPPLAPGAHAARRPGIGVVAQAVVDRARHRAERVVDQVRARAEDGKFLAPGEQRIVVLGSRGSHRVPSSQGRRESCGGWVWQNRCIIRLFHRQPCISNPHKERTMQLGLGLYRHMLTPENFRFARQAGASAIVAHLCDYFAEGPRIPTTGEQGWGQAGRGLEIWEPENLHALKQSVEAEGLTLAAVENLDPMLWYDVLLDGPRKAEQLETVKRIIRSFGEVGIPILGYNFSIAGVWGHVEGPYARGGAETVAFLGPDGPAETPIPNGMVWNMIYDASAPPGEPLTVDRKSVV